MNRYLTAQQIIDLNVLVEDENADDSCDDGEIDNVEAQLDLSSDNEGSEDSEEPFDVPISHNLDPLLSLTRSQDDIFQHIPPSNQLSRISPFSSRGSLSKKASSPLLKRANTTKLTHLASKLPRGNIDVQDEFSVGSPKKILGRTNKLLTNTVFEWFDRPFTLFETFTKMKTKVIPELENIEPSIEIYFKMLITPDMVDKITEFTNQKIGFIDIEKFDSAKYQDEVKRLIKNPITNDEIYAFIGLLILLGITKKSDVNIETLWCESSIHYAPFAAATMTRDKFKLIARNISFDNLETRYERSSKKFHKMSDIFDNFKANLALIIPSFKLCVDEELYAFRGFF